MASRSSGSATSGPGRIEIRDQAITANTNLSLGNYEKVLTGKEYEIKSADGSIQKVQGDDLSGAFINSLAVAIPATLIPILVAAFAAYGFAWMRFTGRAVLFILVVAMLVVPLQIALVPILRDYVALNLNGTYLAVWLAHTGFGLALAVSCSTTTSASCLRKSWSRRSSTGRPISRSSGA